MDTSINNTLHCCFCNPEDCRPGLEIGKCRVCSVLEDMAYERVFSCWRLPPHS